MVNCGLSMSMQDPFKWTLKEMQALQMVVRLGSVTAAAARLEVSQPSISRLIASIESKLGVVLFEREGRGLSPTSAACDFCSQSETVFDALDAMRRGKSGKQSKNIMRIGAPPAFANGYLQKVIMRFLEQSSAVTVKLNVHTSTTIIDRLVDGELDLGITDAAVHHAALQTQSLCIAPMVVYMRKTDILAKQPIVDLKNISSLKMISLSRQHESRQQVEQLLRIAKIQYQILAETSTSQSAIAFVQETGAVAFMSKFPLAENLPEKVTWRPINEDFNYTTRILRPARIGQSVTVKRFIKTLVSTLN